MRDVTAHVYEQQREVAEALSVYLGERGYDAIDTPLLEETELFVRKSGGELTSRLYTFTDPGGYKVSLRPEFTSSVIRHFIEEGATSPARWRYSGPVFRYERGRDGGHRQFWQVGAELVGAAGVEADAEIVCVAWSGLGLTGMRDHELRVGHLGVLYKLLSSYGLSEAAKLFIVSNVQGLKSREAEVGALKKRAESVGLLRGGLGQDKVLDEQGRDAAQEFVQGALEASIPPPIGRRTTEQIVARLLRKVQHADDPIAFETALALVGELAQLQGPPSTVLDEARRLASSAGARSDAFGELEGLLGALETCGIPEGSMVFDLGLARGISYYTGVIFELAHPAGIPSVSLGGGGRYDGLVKALGGHEDAPALGFAYNLDQILDVLRADSETAQAAVGR